MDRFHSFEMFLIFCLREHSPTSNVAVPIPNFVIISNIFLRSLKKKLVLGFKCWDIFRKKGLDKKDFHLRTFPPLSSASSCIFSVILRQLVCMLFLLTYVFCPLAFASITYWLWDTLSTRRICQSRRQKYSITSKNTCFEVFLDGLCWIGHLCRAYVFMFSSWIGYL